MLCLISAIPPSTLVFQVDNVSDEKNSIMNCSELCIITPQLCKEECQVIVELGI